MAAVCVGFASCGDDDDPVVVINTDENGTEVSTKSIVGEWDVVGIRGERRHDSEVVESGERSVSSPYDKIMVYANGTAEYWEYGGDHTGMSDDRGNNYHEDGKFTWVKVGNNYVISTTDWDTCQMVSYDGDNMVWRVTNSEDKDTYVVYKDYYYTLKRVETE